MCMKNKMFQRVIIILILIMMLSTSPTFAVYTFSQGTNTVTKNEYEYKKDGGGVSFKVNKTGVYAVTVLPIIEDFEWQYTIVNGSTNKNISLAVTQDGEDKN